MEVLVNGEIKELTLIDVNGIDLSYDFVVAYERQEFHLVQFEIDGWIEEYWECSQEDFEWWEDICKREQRIIYATNSQEFKALSQKEKREFYNLFDYDLDDNVYYRECWLKEKGVL